MGYSAGLLISWQTGTVGGPALAVNMAGVICSGLAVGLRYFHAWPMLPMYLGLPALIFALGIGLLLASCRRQHRQTDLLLLQGLLVLLCLLNLLYPKDFYLPLIRSATIWAHLFLVFGVLARSALLICGLRALASRWKQSDPRNNTDLSPAATSRPAILGTVCLTLSIFCGAIWSYLGWGIPLIWHDPAVTLTMALWFYWICQFHLVYGGIRSTTVQQKFQIAGGLLVLLSLIPDLGPLRLYVPGGGS
ncbi:cytochrome c biogenesis protein CcsA [Desulfolithobacter sp.]